MFRDPLRSLVGVIAALAALAAVVTVSSSRVWARSSSEQIYVSLFAPSSLAGYHYDSGFVADDIDPRTPETRVSASLDLNRALVATDRYLLSLNLFTGLAVAVVDRATGVELPRPRTTQVTANGLAAAPDGRFAYLLGGAASGQPTFSVIDLRPESPTFDTEIAAIPIPGAVSSVGMAIDRDQPGCRQTKTSIVSGRFYRR